MKKNISTMVVLGLAAMSLAACGSTAEETTAAATTTAAAAEAETEAEAADTTAAETEAAAEELSGAVSTDGSTSMESVIGILGESFMQLHPDVSFTYNPTGSGSGITAVQEGRCDIGLSSRPVSPPFRKAAATSDFPAVP